MGVSALDRLVAAPVGTDELESVATRPGKQAAHRVVGQRREQARQVFGGQVRTRSVMHQHPGVLLHASGHQPVQRTEHRVGALLAAGCGPHPLIGSLCNMRPVRVVGGKADDHALQPRLSQQPCKGVFENGPPGKGQVLLGPIGPHATANAGRGDDAPERQRRRRVHSVSW